MITYRSVKGSGLTNDEIDKNFKSAAGEKPVGVATARAFTAADSDEPIVYTGAVNGLFTIPTGLGATRCKLRVIKGAVGNPSIKADAGVTINGIDGATFGVGTTWCHVEVEAVGLNAFRVISQ